MNDHIKILPASLADYPTIQNMARFYVYDLSRHCGSISDDWALPTDGLYESFDFKIYFKSEDRKAFLIKVEDELAGFVLLNQAGTDLNTNWNIGEFFILAKFQGRGIGRQVAMTIWDMFHGIWEVSVVPENKSALCFWRKTIEAYTAGNYTCEMKTVTYDTHQPQRIIFTFVTHITSYVCEPKATEFRKVLDQHTPSALVSISSQP